MENTNRALRVGDVAPDFDLTTYEPLANQGKGGFGKFSLAEARAAGKWTVLFFYPADFTFL